MIELNIRESMAGRWFRVILTTITSVGPMLLYLVGGILMLRYDSDLTVGDITVLVALLGRMYGPVNSLLGELPSQYPGRLDALHGYVLEDL